MGELHSETTIRFELHFVRVVDIPYLVDFLALFFPMLIQRAPERRQPSPFVLVRKHVCTLSGYHDRTIFSVHWSREGIIASGAADDAICLFVENNDNEVDGPTFKLLLKKEKAHEMDVNSVQWNSGDRKLLASASDDGTVKIWELVRLFGQKLLQT
ncbi:hypothetical protein HAX54_007372 [Datura stramonium]|uniref:Uncharacterized protein n=1 Tax=Datura stramonium TaxID=4076 RepID=A0ABS8WXA8_DATST|nr:hypothetical protein [Datura stramonium]